MSRAPLGVMRRIVLFPALSVVVCLGCTNVYSIGAPPRATSVAGLVVSALWSTTTRVDGVEHEDLERQRIEEDRLARQARTERFAQCAEASAAGSLEPEKLETPAQHAFAERCAVILGM